MGQHVTLASAEALAFAFKVKPATIRKWAQRGHITRQGTMPGRGHPALYDADAVEIVARKFGHVDKPRDDRHSEMTCHQRAQKQGR